MIFKWDFDLSKMFMFGKIERKSCQLHFFMKYIYTSFTSILIPEEVVSYSNKTSNPIW